MCIYIYVGMYMQMYGYRIFGLVYEYRISVYIRIRIRVYIYTYIVCVDVCVDVWVCRVFRLVSLNSIADLHVLRILNTS